MIYTDFHGEKLSLLGFGTMRLPLVPGGTPADIDEKTTADMVRYAMEHGVNYFDTAYPYHGGMSERVMGRVLKDYDRGSFYLATKYPGHQLSSHYDPAAIFEEQLEKCGVDYFDFYLLHNVYEKSIETYTDPRWGIIDYFLEQKKKGRIRHLGFSTHGGLELMERFLSQYGKDMEFCQIQLNYLDWTMQDAKAKCELLRRYNIPIWVMEPIRGGRLASLTPEDEARLRALHPEESVAAWAFRFLQGVEGVQMILSGMTTPEQMQDNVRTFAERRPLTEQEEKVLLDIAKGMYGAVPCTGCRYCCDGCPMGLNIPMLLQVYNEMKFSPCTNVGMRVEALPEDKRPAACVGCGQCTRACPQNIDIPTVLRDLDEELKKIPSWAEICASAKKLPAGPGKPDNMARIIDITDFSAPELDIYARLTENQLVNRADPDNALFVAESPLVIGRALDAGCTPVSFLMERKHITGKARRCWPAVRRIFRCMRRSCRC